MVLSGDYLDTQRSAIETDIDTNWTDVAVGTGTGDASSDDDSLENETLRKDRQESVVETGKVTVSMRITSTEQNGNTLSETGVFDADSGGEMKNRSTFSSIDKNNDFEVWIDHEVDIEVSQS